MRKKPTMSDLTTYLIDTDHIEPEFSTLRRTMPEFISDGVLVLDTRLQTVIDSHTELEMSLQAIADAWNADTRHVQAFLRHNWNDLASLLDALVKGEQP
ncbi:hypothetical protein LCGC14_1435510 [marine sediment metagenome]|uniref:Uncharacterized protein n=1 Tax=marine sediment metagenome TaxID=412755 RepID=A0A0F9MP63_9ZZZZ